jgi:hypothetical protein
VLSGEAAKKFQEVLDRKDALRKRMAEMWPPKEIRDDVKVKTDQVVKLNDGKVDGESFRLGMYSMWNYMQSNGLINAAAVESFVEIKKQ